jgi:hypothetical protein
MMLHGSMLDDHELPSGRPGVIGKAAVDLVDAFRVDDKQCAKASVLGVGEWACELADGAAADRQLAACHVVDHDPGQAARGFPSDRHDRLGELLGDLRLLVIGEHALDYTAVDGRRLRPPLVV